MYCGRFLNVSLNLFSLAHCHPPNKKLRFPASLATRCGHVGRIVVHPPLGHVFNKAGYELHFFLHSCWLRDGEDESNSYFNPAVEAIGSDVELGLSTSGHRTG